VAEPLWKRVVDQESLADSKMVAVAAGSNGFVAVGTRTDDYDAEPSIAWTSSDGRAWARSAYNFGQDLPVVDGIIWDGGQFVAFGSLLEPLVWVSPDGQSWEAAGEIPNQGLIDKFHVTTLDGELYAVGGWFGDDAPDPFGVLRTWTSADGLTWQPVATVTPTELYYFRGLTASNGMLIAWGEAVSRELEHESVLRPVVAHSIDGGRNWQSTFVGKDNNQISDVLGLPHGLLAVGSGAYCCDEGGSWPVRAWTSADALSWSGATFLPDGGTDVLEHVVPYGGGYVALGTDYGDPMSWRTDDGTAWVESSSVPDAAVDIGGDCTGGPCPATTVHDLTAGDLGLVAVGENMKEVGDDADINFEYRSVVWVAPPPEP
jgi:hypothetical protein